MRYLLFLLLITAFNPIFAQTFEIERASSANELWQKAFELSSGNIISVGYFSLNGAPNSRLSVLKHNNFGTFMSSVPIGPDVSYFCDMAIQKDSAYVLFNSKTRWNTNCLQLWVLDSSLQIGRKVFLSDSIKNCPFASLSKSRNGEDWIMISLEADTIGNTALKPKILIFNSDFTQIKKQKILVRPVDSTINSLFLSALELSSPKRYVILGNGNFTGQPINQSRNFDLILLDSSLNLLQNKIAYAYPLPYSSQQAGVLSIFNKQTKALAYSSDSTFLMYGSIRKYTLNPFAPGCSWDSCNCFSQTEWKVDSFTVLNRKVANMGRRDKVVDLTTHINGTHSVLVSQDVKYISSNFNYPTQIQILEYFNRDSIIKTINFSKPNYFLDPFSFYRCKDGGYLITARYNDFLNNAPNDLFTALYKLDSNGHIATSVMPLSAPSRGVKVYPNPLQQSEFQVRLSEELPEQEELWLELLDLNGQLQIRERITSNPATLSVPHLANGLYLWRLGSQQKLYALGKLAISR